MSSALSTTSIKFGTDGWRAVIAEDFTFHNLDRVAQATADFWNAIPWRGRDKTIIVGYDRRFLSDRFGRRVAEVFAGNGFQVLLSTARRRRRPFPSQSRHKKPSAA